MPFSAAFRARSFLFSFAVSLLLCTDDLRPDYASSNCTRV